MDCNARGGPGWTVMLEVDWVDCNARGGPGWTVACN